MTNGISPLYRRLSKIWKMARVRQTTSSDSSVSDSTLLLWCVCFPFQFLWLFKLAQVAEKVDVYSQYGVLKDGKKVSISSPSLCSLLSFLTQHFKAVMFRSSLTSGLATALANMKYPRLNNYFQGLIMLRCLGWGSAARHKGGHSPQEGIQRIHRVRGFI